MVEETFPSWFEGLGYSILHDSDIVPNRPRGQWGCHRDAVRGASPEAGPPKKAGNQSDSNPGDQSECGLSQNQLARAIGISLNQIAENVNSRRRITADTALRLFPIWCKVV